MSSLAWGMLLHTLVSTTVPSGHLSTEMAQLWVQGKHLGIQNGRQHLLGQTRYGAHNACFCIYHLSPFASRGADQHGGVHAERVLALCSAMILMKILPRDPISLEKKSIGVLERKLAFFSPRAKIKDRGILIGPVMTRVKGRCLFLILISSHSSPW